MGDLGLPGSVVEMPDDGAAEGAVGGAQGRPEHHDEPEGRRQAGQLHRGLRGAAGAPGRLHRRADRGVRAATARAAPGTRMPRWARCTCGPSSTCAAADGGAAKMRAIAEEAAELVRKYKGAYSGEHGDGLCRGEWIALAVRPGDQRRVPRDQAAARPGRACSTPARSSTRRRWTTRALFRFAPPGYRSLRIAAQAGARLVGLERAERPGHRSDHRARHRRRHHRRPGQGGGDVQQQRPLPQVRRRHHVPELPRHARRAAPDARPRQHAAAGAVGPARRRRASPATRCTRRMDLCVGCKGCKRDCPTGVDMAQDEDRVHWRTTRRATATR